MIDLLERFKEHLDEADFDEVADIVGFGSGTKIYITGDCKNDDPQVTVYESEDGYCDMFGDLITPQEMFTCQSCQYVGGENEFNEEDTGDLLCPSCGSRVAIAGVPTVEV